MEWKILVVFAYLKEVSALVLVAETSCSSSERKDGKMSSIPRKADLRGTDSQSSQPESLRIVSFGVGTKTARFAYQGL